MRRSAKQSTAIAKAAQISCMRPLPNLPRRKPKRGWIFTGRQEHLACQPSNRRGAGNNQSSSKYGNSRVPRQDHDSVATDLRELAPPHLPLAGYRSRGPAASRKDARSPQRTGPSRSSVTQQFPDRAISPSDAPLAFLRSDQAIGNLFNTNSSLGDIHNELKNVVIPERSTAHRWS
jgi:hypothetical protein